MIVGRYRLIRQLGDGGFGRVWLGRDPELGREVAVKEIFLPPRLTAAQRAELIALTIREAQAAARLRHSNIVTVHDVIEHDGARWIVMEYIDGESLRDRIDNEGRLAWRQVVELCEELAGALAHAHRNGIIHRDLKPANILLDGDQPVITDFGIARIIDASSRPTRAGAGTLHYMAPEQADGEHGDPPVDVWSLGVTLYELVEGKKPFDGITSTTVLTAILTRDPPPAVHAGPLAGLLTRMLDKDPARRPTAAAVAQELNTLRKARTGTPSSAPAPGSRLRPPPVMPLPGSRGSTRPGLKPGPSSHPLPSNSAPASIPQARPRLSRVDPVSSRAEDERRRRARIIIWTSASLAAFAVILAIAVSHANTPSAPASSAKPTTTSSPQPIPPTQAHLICDVNMTSSYARDGSDCTRHNMYSGDSIALKVSGFTQHVVRELCRRGYHDKWSSTAGDNGGGFGMCEELSENILSSDGLIFEEFHNPDMLGKDTVTWILISPAGRTVLTAEYSFRVLETLTSSLPTPPS